MSSRITRDASVKLCYLRPGSPAWSQLTGARATTSSRELTLIGDRPLAMPRNGTFLAEEPNTVPMPFQNWRPRRQKAASLTNDRVGCIADAKPHQMLDQFGVFHPHVLGR